MRIAALQLDVRRGDVAANVARALDGLREAAERGVELCLLPEMWPTSFVAEGEDDDWLRLTREAWDAVFAVADELDVAVAGSAFGPSPAREDEREGDDDAPTRERDDDTTDPTSARDDVRPPSPARLRRPRNRFVLHDRGADLLAYDKVHLFSLTGENVGFSAGTVPPPTVRWRGLLVSAVVCYDLRFARLMRAPYDDEAELVLVPAQWPVTRAAHWRALVLGRAVEHQAFLLGANRTGSEPLGRRGAVLDFPGNSLVVSPHGAVLAEGRGADGLVVADVDPEEVRELRERVPVRRDQRPDAYRR